MTRLAGYVPLIMRGCYNIKCLAEQGLNVSRYVRHDPLGVRRALSDARQSSDKMNIDMQCALAGIHISKILELPRAIRATLLVHRKHTRKPRTGPCVPRVNCNRYRDFVGTMCVSWSYKISRSSVARVLKQAQ
jgi:hypothetical protein